MRDHGLPSSAPPSAAWGTCRRPGFGLPLLSSPPVCAGLHSAAVRLPRHSDLIWSQNHAWELLEGTVSIIWPSSPPPLNHSRLCDQCVPTQGFALSFWRFTNSQTISYRKPRFSIPGWAKGSSSASPSQHPFPCVCAGPFSILCQIPLGSRFKGGCLEPGSSCVTGQFP